MKLKKTDCERCDDGVHEIADVLLTRDQRVVVGPAETAALLPAELITRLGFHRGIVERCPRECGDPLGARPREWIHEPRAEGVR